MNSNKLGSQPFKDLPVFFAGDFNCEPNEQAIRILERGCFTDLYGFGKGIIHQKEHPGYSLIFDTNEKYPRRPTPMYALLDYIMVWRNNFLKRGNGNSFAVTGIFDLPTDRDRRDIHIPGAEWPSDHFSLLYKVVIGFDAHIQRRARLIRLKHLKTQHAAKKVIRKSERAKTKLRNKAHAKKC